LQSFHHYQLLESQCCCLKGQRNLHLSLTHLQWNLYAALQGIVAWCKNVVSQITSMKSPGKCSTGPFASFWFWALLI
jgi:hypothetical protein